VRSWLANAKGALKYVAKVHGGFTPALRAAVFERFQGLGLETKTCPFKNLPEARRGQWDEGLTAAEMEKSRWLLVATIDYLERTVANHLWHSVFVGLAAILLVPYVSRLQSP
jgi:ATP-dependent DNA ligase